MRRAQRAAALFLAVALCAVLGGCSSSSSSRATPSSTLRSFDSLEELSDALGFEMVKLDGGGFQPYQYASIDGSIGQIEYRRGDAVLLLRMSDGDERDITGVGQVEYATTNHGGAELHIGSFKDVQSAWITAGDYTYAMSSSGLGAEEFQSLAGQLADAVAAA